MIGIIAKKYLSEKNFNKLRELKYRLYCLSKGWTFKKVDGNYEILALNKKFIFNLNKIDYTYYIPAIAKLVVEKIINLNKKYFYININNLKIKTDSLAFAEFDSAIKKYNSQYILKKGDVVLDIGAYHGIYSFFILSQIGGPGKIYAFEPDPYNYKILSENIKKNKIKNIIPIKKALFNKTGEQKFAVSSAGSSIYQNEHRLNGNPFENKVIITVPTISFADFIKEYKVKNIDFIKMDCEGSEIEICKNYLENSPKKIKTHFAIASYHYREDYMSKTNKILKKMFGSKNIKTIDKNKKHLTTYIDTTL